MTCTACGGTGRARVGQRLFNVSDRQVTMSAVTVTQPCHCEAGRRVSEENARIRREWEARHAD